MDTLHIYGYIAYLWIPFIYMDTLHIYRYLAYIWISCISIDTLYIYGYLAYMLVPCLLYFLYITVTLHTQFHVAPSVEFITTDLANCLFSDSSEI